MPRINTSSGCKQLLQSHETSLYTVYMNSIHSPSFIPLSPSQLTLTMVEGRIPAGFPSPADDFNTQRCSLIEMLTPHPLTTFLWRVSGRSMEEAGIFDGDILVVDRSLNAHHGDVVVAQVDNDFTVKYLHQRYSRIKLVPANPTYPDIVPQDGQQLLIVGVVTASIKQFRKLV